jgi:hypothetical protein
MGQVIRDRGGVRKQPHAPAFKRRAQGGFGEKSIEAGFHG